MGYLPRCTSALPQSKKNRTQNSLRSSSIAGISSRRYQRNDRRVYPLLFHGAAAAGFHLHFISDDRTFAGHVLDFEVAAGEVELMELAEFRQHFPIDNQDYLQRETMSQKSPRDIEVAE